MQKQLLVLPDHLSGSIRDWSALLGLARMRQLVLTSSTLLQNGEMVMSQFFAIQDQTVSTKQGVLQIAGSMASNLNRPIFQAVKRGALEAGLSLREVETEELPGGIMGRLDRTWYYLGKEQAMREEGIELGVSSQAVSSQLELEGKEILYLAQKQPKRLLAIFAGYTPLNQEASITVNALHGLGLELILLTGQKTRVIKGLTMPLGIQLLHSELGVEEKRRIIQMFQEKHEAIGFLTNSQTVSLVPSRALIILQSKRIAATAGVWSRNLIELPEQIEYARNSLDRAQKRFFWCKI